MNVKQRKIYYVDGLCASGKTYSLGKYIEKNQSALKIMVATPSKILADEIYNTFDTIGIINLYKVHSGTTTHNEKVVNEIMDLIKISNITGSGVVVCTQQALSYIPFFENKDEWQLVVDEIPSIDKYYEPSLPYGNTVLNNYITVDKTVGTNLYEIRSLLEEKPGLNYDSILEPIMPIIEGVYSNNYLTYTLKSQWDKIVNDGNVTNDSNVDKRYKNAMNKLNFVSLLQPNIYEGFELVVIMGANFQNSMLHYYWKEYKKIEFLPFEPIEEKLRYTCYTNGYRLRILYLQEENWSKYSAQKVNENGLSRIEDFRNKVVNYFGENRFIYMKNNGDPTSFENGIEVPVISHGLNSYSDIDGIYFSPALNYIPQHTLMMQDLGFNKEYIKRATFHEVLHQGVMRTSLRNPDATTTVIAIVPDFASAESLGRLFTGCHIGPIDGCLKRVSAISQTNRNRKYKVNKLIEQYNLTSLVVGRTGGCNEEKMSTNSYSIKEKRNQNLPKSDICNDTKGSLVARSFIDDGISGALLSDIYNKSIKSYDSNTMDFIRLMKKLYNSNIITKKDEVNLFNGVSYKTDDSRCLNDAAYASLCVVDIDNGDLSPNEFFKIFSTKNKHSFIQCNSFSRSEDKPNAYRAIFFIDQPVTDDVYRMIHLYLQKILANYGFITATKKEKEEILKRNPNAKFSGMDLTKNHTASFFYLPCKVVGREEWAFFNKGNVKDIAQLKRYAIKVDNVIQYSPDEFELPKLVYEADKYKDYDQIDLKEIKDFIIQNKPYVGSHKEYGRMAAAMKSTGFSLSDFVDVTPFISESKTDKDARYYWNNWGSKPGYNHKPITIKTLLHLIGYKKAS